MKAPDKIYLVETTRIIDEWRLRPNPLCTNNYEYIRKDALLEWAEDFKAKKGWYEIEVEIAKELSIKPQSVWKIEKNKSFPKPKTIEKFCEVAKIPLAYFYAKAMTMEDYIIK